MTDPKQIKLANQEPLNQAAAKFLPPDWQGDDMTEIHVLSLMRWGLENGVEINPISPDLPNQNQVESMINRLAQGNPKEAMRFLTEPEGEAVLDAEELLEQDGPLDAAMLLLETLHNSMSVTAP